MENTCLLFHKWDKWKRKEEGTIMRKDGGLIGQFITQQRECKRCGFTQINRQKISIV